MRINMLQVDTSRKLFQTQCFVSVLFQKVRPALETSRLQKILKLLGLLRALFN